LKVEADFGAGEAVQLLNDEERPGTNAAALYRLDEHVERALLRVLTAEGGHPEVF